MKGKKTGGRKKGTVNKVTALSKDIISSMLADYHVTGLMDKDFMSLKPMERLQIAEKMMQYVMPKIQSVSLDVTEETVQTIEERLRKLAEDEE